MASHDATLYQPGRFNLPPRLFTQLTNPLKRVASSSVVLERANLDRSDYLTSIDTGRSVSSVCIGHFWDSKKMMLVHVKMGLVMFRPVGFLRSSASCAAVSHKSFSRVEADVLSKSFLPDEYRPERSEDGTEEGRKMSGSYVIPGQSPTDWTKQQKNEQNGRTKSHVLYFEWSVEKCEAEIC